jgi:hypothetical protein
MFNFGYIFGTSKLRQELVNKDKEIEKLKKAIANCEQQFQDKVQEVLAHQDCLFLLQSKYSQLEKAARVVVFTLNYYKDTSCWRNDLAGPDLLSKALANLSPPNKGDKIKFYHNNNALYYMDMWFHRCMPSDIEFTVTDKVFEGKKDWVELVAPGFGDKDHYGCGSIFIQKKDIQQWSQNIAESEPLGI